MMAMVVATGCAGLFAGAAIYVTLVELPARVGEGSELAVREFGPSSSRAVALLTRWGRRQAVRTVLGSAAFLVFLWRLSRAA
jgi:hypothetical protein